MEKRAISDFRKNIFLRSFPSLLKTISISYRYLPPTAVPSQWPGVPKYLSTPKPKPWSTQASTSAARAELHDQYQEQLEFEQTIEESVLSIQELEEKLSNLTLPTDFYLVKSPKLALIRLHQTTTGLEVVNSVEFENDLSFTLIHSKVKLNNKTVSHITNNGKVNTVMEAYNLAAHLGAKESLTCSESFDDILKRFHVFSQSNELEPLQASKLSFILEQLNLLFAKPTGRRYSPEFLATALLWENTSSSLYKQMLSSNLLTLPNPRHLKRLSEAVTVETGFSLPTIKYLEARIKPLSERERHVNLMMDEIYSAQRVEFVGGKFFGCEDGNVTKTVLALMIGSAGGKYQDVVALVTVPKISAEFLASHWSVVMKGLWEIGFTVVSTSVDNHTANRKFFTQILCGGNLKTSIPHPHDPSKKVFLIFDMTHNFKNNYNGFLNRELFVCPNFGADQPLKPNFAHLREIHSKESGHTPKMAHKLSLKALNPTSIEKTNVMLADAITHESTIGALRVFAKDESRPEFNDTADYLEYVRTMWNIVNVKSKYAGIQKRDEYREPITEKNQLGLHFLREFADFLATWEASDPAGKKSLTKETFLATRHSCLALADLSEYLLALPSQALPETHIFLYILLGLFQSDRIERRFGRYRQLSGGNYYISVRQMLESEKKIRIHDLVKFSGMTITEVKALLNDCLETAAVILTNWTPTDMNSLLTNAEGNALFFVAGYIAFKLKKHTECVFCRNLLVSSDSPPQNVSFDNPETSEQTQQLKEFTDVMSRGGLSTPSDALFMICLHAHSMFTFIMNSPDEKKTLKDASNPRASFVATFCEKMEDSTDPSVSALVKAQCEVYDPLSNHLSKIAQRMFNVMGKNFMANANDDVRAQKRGQNEAQGGKKSSAARKVAKLQSESS